MALEVTLGNFNVMPAQAGIHDFSSASCSWTVKSWIPAFAGMTDLVGQSPGYLVLKPDSDIKMNRERFIFMSSRSNLGHRRAKIPAPE
jgi:hypothetical protein